VPADADAARGPEEPEERQGGVDLDVDGRHAIDRLVATPVASESASESRISRRVTAAPSAGPRSALAA
jgi:hypothetical protein